MAHYPPAPKWKVGFWRLLYPFYRNNLNVAGMIRNRITPVGVTVIVGLFLAAVLRTGMAANVLFQLIAVLFAMLSFSLLVTWFRRPKVEVRRYIPKMASVDTPLTYGVEVKNDGKFGVSAMRLREMPPDPRPSRGVFVHTREPGEEQRNTFDRLFVYYRWQWLLKQTQGFRFVDSGPVEISKGGTTLVTITITPNRRGMLELKDMRALLPDPLYLFQRCRRLRQEHDKILVLPKRYKLPDILLAGESRNQLGGEAQSRQLGDSSEFVSLRDYRSGDPLKHIDWKSWAKTGKPIVKEFEDVYFPRHGLVLDAVVHPSKVMVFEEAVSIASSFACAIDTRESILDLILLQQDTQVITVGKGVAKLDKMLEVLACAELEREPHWEKMLEQIVRLGDSLSSCIAVFADWSEERAELVKKCVMLDVPMVVILVCEDSEEAAALVRKYPTLAAVQFVQSDRVQDDLSALRSKN